MIGQIRESISSIDGACAVSGPTGEARCFARFVDDCHVGVNQRGSGVALKRRNADLELSREPLVVVIDERYQVAAAGGDSGVARRGESAVGLANHPDPISKAGQHRRRVVSRSVVADYDFVVSETLIENAV